MTPQPATVYRYRAFTAASLESLCEDTLYFASPGTFNDPLDCTPTIECDSNLHDLRNLLDRLIRLRVAAEIGSSLARARVKGAKAREHAHRHAAAEAARTLEELAYHATNPDYSIEPSEAEAGLLTQEVQLELLRHYERGVCCFSTTFRSPILWSHYGDQHRGFCVGYGTERKPKPALQRVQYGGQRGVTTSTLIKVFLNGDAGARQELERNILLRKAKGWDYEREWRLVGGHGSSLSPLLMKEVTFGLRCPYAVAYTVIRALEGRQIPLKFFQMYQFTSRFTLRRSPVDVDELGSRYPRTAESGEELFSPLEP